MEANATLHSRSGISKVWIYGFGAAGIAAVANVILLLIGKAANVPFLVPGPGDPEVLRAVDPIMVIMATVIALGIGTAATALIAPRITNGLTRFQVLAATLTVLSLGAPLTQAGGATSLWLASMHLVAGVAIIAALQRARNGLTTRRRRPLRSAVTTSPAPRSFGMWQRPDGRQC